MSLYPLNVAREKERTPPGIAAVCLLILIKHSGYHVFRMEVETFKINDA